MAYSAESAANRTLLHTTGRGVRRLEAIAEMAKTLRVDPIAVVVDDGCAMQIRPDAFGPLTRARKVEVIARPDAGHALLGIRFGEVLVTTLVTAPEAAFLTAGGDRG